MVKVNQPTYKIGDTVTVIKPKTDDLLMRLLGWIKEGQQSIGIHSMDAMIGKKYKITNIEKITMMDGSLLYAYCIGPYKFSEICFIPSSTSLSSFLNDLRGVNDV